MKLARDWVDYKILALDNGEKLENWNGVILLRPDPQVIWNNNKNLAKTKDLNAHYLRSDTGGGHWETIKQYPSEWLVHWKDLSFKVKPMGFKHTGIFPEQAVNWEIMMDLIKNSNREINVLNLFAYTGGATVACLKAGAKVCHVDAAKNMVERAKENVNMNNLNNGNVRFIVDDCLKFVEKEIRRNKKYDAIIMDPPSYGRGPSGEMWKIENDLYNLVIKSVELLSDKPLFYLINSYTTGLQPTVLSNILSLALKKFDGKVEAYEVCIESVDGSILPCGASGLFYTK